MNQILNQLLNKIFSWRQCEENFSNKFLEYILPSYDHGEVKVVN